MPSSSVVPSTTNSLPSNPSPAHFGEAAQALAAANRALWLATLGLMTAFMQMPAPAHRYLLARRIARNLETLSQQECFDGASRSTFGRLAQRWDERAGEFAPKPAPAFGGFLRFLS